MPLKYRIASIGWYNFETLVQTLLKGVIGAGVTSFGGTKDRGRDATFQGAASFPSQETQWDGHWVFQVKYVDVEQQGIGAARAQLKRTFAKEIRAILADRAPEVLPDNYILIADVPLTAANRADLDAIVEEAGFSGNFRAIDGKEVCEFLDLLPQVRRSYPQLLGLADLDRILNRDLYGRSEAYVQEWQPRLATFVQTEPYRKAVSTLAERHFVVLDGPPEAGKSTIAAALALSRAADGFEVIDLRVPGDLFKVFHPQALQLFVADDAVGSVWFNPSLTDDWSRDLPGILRKLDKQHLLVWTARRYVLAEAIAESRLGEATPDFPGIHQVLVEVHELTAPEKAAIVYNHAKRARLPAAACTLIRDNAREIATHPNFTPERIRQLIENVLSGDGRSDLGDAAPPSWQGVSRFLQNPGERWIQAHRKLSESEQTLLLTMLDFNRAARFDELRRAYEVRCAHHSGLRLEFEECVNRLDHSFLRVTGPYASQRYVDFQHPSLRDMLLSRLKDDEAARRRHIALASPTGVSNLIQGVATSAAREAADTHVLFPTDEAELSILLTRLTDLSSGVLQVAEWQGILSATELLLPRDSSRRKVPPAEADIYRFRESWMGKITEAVVRAFASRETYERNQRYSLAEWIPLLDKFYTLAVYLVPPPRPEFLPDLVCELKEHAAWDSIALANLMQPREPLLIAQGVTKELLASWNDQLRDALQDCIRIWQELGLGEDDEALGWPDTVDDQYSYVDEDEYYRHLDEIESWREEAGRVVPLARAFYGWAPFDAPSALLQVELLMGALQAPYEPDSDYYGAYETEGPDVEYWTIERIFEDL